VVTYRAGIEFVGPSAPTAMVIAEFVDQLRQRGDRTD
jgi:hypothetical protein